MRKGWGFKRSTGSKVLKRVQLATRNHRFQHAESLTSAQVRVEQNNCFFIHNSVTAFYRRDNDVLILYVIRII